MLDTVFPREVVPWGGREIVVTPATFHARMLLKEYLECEVVKALHRKRHLYPSEAAFLKVESQLYRDFGAYLYAFGRRECVRCLEDDEHLKHYLFLALTAPRPDGTPSPNVLDREAMDKLWDDTLYEAEDEAGQKVTRNRLLEAFERVSAPNPPTPPERAASSPTT